MPESQTAELIELVNRNHAAVVAANAQAAKDLGEVQSRLSGVEQEVARRQRVGNPSASAGWGYQVTAATEFKGIAGNTAAWRGRARFEVKNALTSAPGSGGSLVAPDRQREIVMLPQAPLRIRDLLAPGTTGSNMIEYSKQSGPRTLNAAVVSEGALKPESDITFEPASAPVRSIAHALKTSKRILDDVPQLESTIDAEMRYGVGLAEEVEILLGDGTGEHLHGLIPQATDFVAPFAVGAENMIDRLLLAIAQAEAMHLPATGIVLNPLDWRRMQALKDGQDRYIGAGPFGPQLAVAWNLPVVTSPSIGLDEFLVGNFMMAAQVFDRQQTVVEISTEDGDNFRRNMVTIRAESRLALAVKRGWALVYGEFGNVTD